MNEATIGPFGILGDRALALIDQETGKVVSAKSVRHFPNILDCTATYVESPAQGIEPPPVTIKLPNGGSVTSDSDDADDKLSAFFNRSVRLARVAPDDFTIEQYHPDIEGADPLDRQGQTVDQKLGSALFNDLGMDSPVPPGSFFDLFPITVITSSTLNSIEQLHSKSGSDPRRFRMNIVVGTKEEGFPENQWVSSQISIGENSHLVVTMQDPRCVMVTLNQAELPKESAVLSMLTQHNRIQVADIGKFPCAGVYAVVAKPGIIKVGDPVVVQSQS